MQERRNSSTLAMGFRLSCTNPSILKCLSRMVISRGCGVTSLSLLPPTLLSAPSLPLSLYMYIIYIVNVLMIVYVYITYCSMILIRSDEAHISRLKWFFGLTHWGRVTHLCVSKLATIGSNNGLSPGRRQTIIWTNAGILLIGPLGTNLSEILSEIHTFSLKKMHLKMSSRKWRPFCSASIHTWTHCLVN